jgi:hypothetical protein
MTLSFPPLPLGWLVLHRAHVANMEYANASMLLRV